LPNDRIAPSNLEPSITVGVEPEHARDLFGDALGIPRSGHVGEHAVLGFAQLHGHGFERLVETKS
jgi:hypothetical protein